MMSPQEMCSACPGPSDKRLRLLLFAMGTLYLLLALGLLLNEGLFSLIGVDFRVFFASAQIAWEEGFPKVYDLSTQEVVQQTLVAPYTSSRVGTLWFFYPPPFLLPFLPLVPLGIARGFLVWLLVNLLLFIGYLNRFLQATEGSERPLRSAHLASGPNERLLLISLALLSFPSFTNLLCGQVNVWLMVCVGEFQRNWGRNPFRSGLWMGGLLIKPQVLLLILPFLILSGEWKVLSGFSVVLVAIGVLSFMLLGPKGMEVWVTQFISHTGNEPSLHPQLMINFRMVGELLSIWLPEIAPELSAGLSIGVALLALLYAIRVNKRASEQREEMLLLLLAATTIVSWHMHAHTALILLPPLLYHVLTGQISTRFFTLWTLLPPAVYFLCAAAISVLIGLGKDILPFPGFTYPALVLLALHNYLLIRKFWRNFAK
ncbi:MAG: glycosyltransferase 87 family protein [Anaerolineae bacterium]|nr:glycosyltransferase 87 family protein [Anaerolineae bacterium]